MTRTQRLLERDDVEDAVIDGDYDDQSALQDDMDQEEQVILNEFAANEDDVNWNIKVYRDAEKGRNKAFLFDCSPSDLPILERLRDQYGTGNFRALVYRNGKLRRHLKYAIEAPKYHVPENQAANTEASAVALALNNQSSMMGDLINKITQQQTAPIQPLDPMAMMQSMVAMMAGLQNLMPAAPVNDSKQMMDMFIQGITLAKEMGDSDGETNFMDIARDVMKSLPLGQMMQNAQNPSPNQPAISAHPNARPINPQGQNQAPNPQSEISPQNEQEQETMMIKMFLEQLVSQAKRNGDVEIYAAMILDNVEPQKIHNFLITHDPKTYLTGISTGIAQYWPWFEALMTALKIELTELGFEGHTDPHDQATGNPVNIDGDPVRQGRDENDIAPDVTIDETGKEVDNNPPESG